MSLTRRELVPLPKAQRARRPESEETSTMSGGRTEGRVADVAVTVFDVEESTWLSTTGPNRKYRMISRRLTPRTSSIAKKGTPSWTPYWYPFTITPVSASARREDVPDGSGWDGDWRRSGMRLPPLSESERVKSMVLPACRLANRRRLHSPFPYHSFVGVPPVRHRSLRSTRDCDRMCKAADSASGSLSHARRR